VSQILQAPIRDRIILVCLAFLIFGADQISKYLVLEHLGLGELWNPVPGLERFVSITHVINTGAAFGLFPNQGSLFAIVAVIVVVAILAYYRYLPTNNWLVRLSLALQLGGALGNLADRVQYGHVIDFIDFKIWPVFNLADVSIVTGVGILAYFLIQEPDEGDKELREPGDGTDGMTPADLPEGSDVSPWRY
jgi:signal peptidase II